MLMTCLAKTSAPANERKETSACGAGQILRRGLFHTRQVVVVVTAAYLLRLNMARKKTQSPARIRFKAERTQSCRK